MTLPLYEAFMDDGCRIRPLAAATYYLAHPRHLLDAPRLALNARRGAKRIAKFAAKYAVGKVPRPPHWSGFRVVPSYLEFWQDGKFRLHDRLVYHREGDGWRTERLFP